MIVECTRPTDSGLVFDPESGAYRTRFDPTRSDSLEYAVVSAVAAVADVGKAPLDDVLYDAIDPDALTALFSPSRDGSGSPTTGVWFTFADHRVIVRTDGDIAIYPPEAEPESIPLRSDPAR